MLKYFNLFFVYLCLQLRLSRFKININDLTHESREGKTKVGNRRNVIMLNGKHYDALTGTLIKQSTPNDKPVVTPNNQAKNKAGSMDGVVSVKPRQQTAHQTKRRIEHSKTLMRSTVKRPDKPLIATPETASKKVITQKSAHLNPQREHRAKQVHQSSHISKFRTGPDTTKAKLSPLPVAKEPPLTIAATTTPQIAAKNTSSQSASKNRFQSAIDASNSHNQPKIKRTNRRTKLAHRLRISPGLLNVGLVILTMVVLGGYFAYNNVPNLAMRIASTRSGLNGSLPDYQPSGFSMKGPIQYQPGQITVVFRSNSDDRNYTVSEKTSNWDSESLLENHVAVNKRSYQTFQDKGKTIYIYDGDSASWMDNGIWYEIKGNASLDTDQMLRIANSL